MKSVKLFFYKYKNQIIRSILPLTLLVMIILSISIRSEDSYAPKNYGIKYNDSWKNALTGEKIIDSTIEIEPGTNILIETKLPNNLNDLCTIGFYDRGFFVVAYVEGNEIFHSGDTYNRVIGKEQSIAWRYIPLKAEYSGKKITLAIQNDYISKINFDLSSIVFGSASDITNIIIKDNFFDIIIFIICQIAAVLLFIFSYALKKSHYISFYQIIKHLAIISCDVGLFVVSYDCAFQLFFKNPSIRYSLSYTSFILMPMILTLYFETLVNDDIKLFKMLLNFYACIMSIAVISYIANFIHITDTIFITDIFLIIEVILINYICVSIYIKEKTKDNFIHMLVSFACSIYIIPCLILYYLTYTEWIALIVGFGFIIYLVITLFTQVRHIRMKYNSERMEEKFKALARVEGVTNGNSRIVAMEKLNEKELFLYGNPWFLHMDLIDFSSVNVSLGWENGNIILKDIYNECQKLLRDDEIICSIGDSDFIFLISPERSIDDFCLRATELINSYIEKKWEKIYLKAKFSAIKIQKDESLDSILDHTIMAYNSPYADYHKHSNCYYYNDKCAEDVKQHFIIESKINTAIDNNEFVMFLQPKVSVETGIVEGAEALVRWNSKEDGLISPGVFIPVAEKSGQIGKIDLVMFRKVCEYLSYRKEKGLRPIKISVNVSKKDISRENFFLKYEKIIKETNAPLENLEFEFTESSAYEEIEPISRIIEKIHILGSKASIDDFGTSYSNLGAINRLRFDIIKLDKLFFDNGFPSDYKNYTLVKGIIDMFHNLDMKIVCEGVEKQEQVDALKELKADLIQGFYYSKPMPVEEFEAYIGDK